MKNKIAFLVLAAMSAALFSCNKESELAESQVSAPAAQKSLVTKAYGDKTPKIVVYVETNDVNPLNAGDYCMCTTTCESTCTNTFVDIVELFAANIHDDGNGDPCLYLNDKLTPVLEYGGAATYVAPLQAKGMKVLLTVLGDWDGIGVANLSDTQATKFAKILAYAVNRYGLDGIGFDDEYADYSGSLVSGSYGNLITKLRAELGNDKLITVFKYGNTSQIGTTAGAQLNYAYGDFLYWRSNSGISGVGTSQWAPYSINIGYTYSSTWQSYFQTVASNAANGGYGALMFFNLRPISEVNPLPVFQKIAAGAYNSTVSLCTNVPTGVTSGDRPRDAGSITGGYTITYDDI